MTDSTASTFEREASPRLASFGAGIERLVESAGFAVERLPALRAVFEDLAATCAECLEETTSEAVTIAAAAVMPGKADLILAHHTGNAVFSLVHAPEWKSRLVIGLSRSFVFTLTELQFGGDGAETPLQDDRPFTAIETHLATTFLGKVTAALQSALTPVASVNLSVERSETRLDPIVLGKATPVIVTTLALQTIGRGGVLFVIIPQTALMPFRGNLARDPAQPRPPHDPIWSEQFGAQVSRTQLRLNARLANHQLTLGDIAKLKVGDVLPLDTVAGSRIQLECNGRTLFWCDLGQSEGRYQVRVERSTGEQRELIESITSTT